MHTSAAFGDSVASAETTVGDGVAAGRPVGSEVGGVVGAGVLTTGARDAIGKLLTIVGVGVVSTSGGVDGAGVLGAGAASSAIPGSAGFSHTNCLFTWDTNGVHISLEVLFAVVLLPSPPQTALVGTKSMTRKVAVACEVAWVCYITLVLFCW